MQMMLEMKSEKEERLVSLEIRDPKDLRPVINALPDGVVISLDMEEVLGYGQKTE